jgi:hypothetical protein
MPHDVWDVDETASYAQRAGKLVRLVLQVPGEALPPGEVVVRLRSADDMVRCRATVRELDSCAMLEASVPARRLGGAVWHLAVRPEAGADFVRVRARLLAKPGQPVALMPGPTPRTRMPEPQATARAAALERLVRVARRARARVVK